MSRIAPLNPLSAAAAQVIDYVEQRLAQAGFAVGGVTSGQPTQVPSTFLPGDAARLTDPEPRADGYPTTQAYHEAWYRWRALQRDAELTPEERAAQFDVFDQALAARPRR